MLPAAPEADELQQLPLELPRYLLVALRESGGHRAYALLPPYAPPAAPYRAPAVTNGKKKLLARSLLQELSDFCEVPSRAH